MTIELFIVLVILIAWFDIRLLVARMLEEIAENIKFEIVLNEENKDE